MSNIYIIYISHLQYKNTSLYCKKVEESYKIITMSENIDKIIYINLDKRVDRLEEIQNELKSYKVNYMFYYLVSSCNFN